MKKLVFYLFYFICANNSLAQQLPFWDEIKSFKQQDSVSFPAKNQILFVGSSSFRMWNNLEKYFPGYDILNRGFGGSSLLDVIKYADEIILPYHPKQIVIYCGENDLAASDTVTPVMVLNRFKSLYYLITSAYPQVPVLYVSIKPSPSRAHLLTKMKQSNKLIRHFLSQQKNTKYVDVHHKMLDGNGLPLNDIFLEDKLHMNAKGYTIWQKTILPHLIK